MARSWSTFTYRAYRVTAQQQFEMVERENVKRHFRD
jgi:hypothetical protein